MLHLFKFCKNIVSNMLFQTQCLILKKSCLLVLHFSFWIQIRTPNSETDTGANRCGSLAEPDSIHCLWQPCYGLNSLEDTMTTLRCITVVPILCTGIFLLSCDNLETVPTKSMFWYPLLCPNSCLPCVSWEPCDSLVWAPKRWAF
jgi:hypothetical protein